MPWVTTTNFVALACSGSDAVAPAMYPMGTVRFPQGVVSTLDLTYAIEDASYQNGLIFRPVSTLPLGYSLNTAGILRVSEEAPVGVSNLSVAVFNGWGNKRSLTVTVSMEPFSAPVIDAMADVALGSSLGPATIEPFQSAINTGLPGSLVWSAYGAIAPYIDASTGVITVPQGVEIEKASYRVQCTGTYGTANRYITIYVSAAVAAAAVGTMGAQTLTTGLTTIDMGPLFTGENLVYAITRDVLGAASLSGTKLEILAAYRGTSYDIDVTVTGTVGLTSTTAMQTIHVTEAIGGPAAVGSVAALIDLTVTARTIDFAAYFVGPSISYSVAANAYGATMTGSVLSVAPAYRGATYVLTVNATNASGTSYQTVSVTEKIAPATKTLATPPAVTGLSVTKVTVDMSLYFTGPSIVYTVTYDPQGSATILGSVLTIVPAYRGITYAVEITATNSSGTDKQSVYVTEKIPPPLKTVAAPAALTGLMSTAATVDFLPYFTGSSIVYTVSTNTYGATMTGSVLNIAPAYRGITYNLTVTATNSSGSDSQSISVTEKIAPPVKTGTPTAQTGLGNTVVTLGMASYFTGSSITYAVSTNTYGATMTGSTLNLAPAYRGTTYSLTVTATNSSGSDTQSVSVTEKIAPPLKTVVTPAALVGLMATAATVDFLSFFTGSSLTYAVSTNTYGATMTGSVLNIAPAYRGITYNLTVTATNSSGSDSQSISVTEKIAPPVKTGTPTAQTGLGNTVVTLGMASYFTGSSITYAVSTNTYGATMTGSTLNLAPAYRGTTYSLTVTATNSSGSDTQSISVSETSSTQYLSTGSYTVDAAALLGAADSYSVAVVPAAYQGAVTLTGSVLTVQGNCRNASYVATLTANKASVLTTSSVTVVEPMAPAAIPAGCQGLYSLFVLSDTYAGPVANCRRSSDNVTSDFYNVNGQLCTTAAGTVSITSWLSVGGSTAFVATWYDQSGSGRNATMATAASQPSVNVATMRVAFGVSQYLTMPDGTIPYGNTTYTVTAKHGAIIANAGNDYGALWGSGAIAADASMSFNINAANLYLNWWGGDDLACGTPVSGNVVTCKYDQASRYMYVNGSQIGARANVAVRNSTSANNTIGKCATYWLNGDLDYLAIFADSLSDQSRLAVEGLYSTAAMSPVLNFDGATLAPLGAGGSIASWSNKGGLLGTTYGATGYGTSGTPLAGVVTGTSVAYPPFAMTANSCSPGKGTYEASASSIYDASADAWKAFDVTVGMWTASGNTWYSNNGNYTGSASTTIGGVAYAGEWLQFKMPYPVLATSYSFVTSADSARCPTAWAVAGSVDGASWDLLDSKTGQTTAANATVTGTVSGFSSFSYFRLVIKSLPGNGAFLSIVDFHMYAAPPRYHAGFVAANSQYFNITKAVPMTWFNNAGVYKGMTVFVVAQYTGAPGNYEQFLNFSNGAGIDTTSLQRVGTTSAFEAYMCNGSTSLAGVNNVAIPPDSAFHIFVVNFMNSASGSSTTVYVDGTIVGSTITSATPITNRTTATNYLGRYPSAGANYLSANIRQIEMFDSSLSAPDMALAYRSLATKWGMFNDGSTPGRAAASAAAIKTLTGTNVSGFYWLLVGGVPTMTSCTM